MSEITFRGDWRRDPHAYDPCVRIRDFEYDGTLYQARTSFPEGGWPFTVRRMDGTFVGSCLDWKEAQARVSALTETDGLTPDYSSYSLLQGQEPVITNGADLCAYDD